MGEGFLCVCVYFKYTSVCAHANHSKPQQILRLIKLLFLADVFATIDPPIMLLLTLPLAAKETNHFCASKLSYDLEK